MGVETNVRPGYVRFGKSKEKDSKAVILSVYKDGKEETFENASFSGRIVEIDKYEKTIKDKDTKYWVYYIHLLDDDTDSIFKLELPRKYGYTRLIIRRLATAKANGVVKFYGYVYGDKLKMDIAVSIDGKKTGCIPYEDLPKTPFIETPNNENSPGYYDTVEHDKVLETLLFGQIRPFFVDDVPFTKMGSYFDPAKDYGGGTSTGSTSVAVETNSTIKPLTDAQKPIQAAIAASTDANVLEAMRPSFIQMGSGVSLEADEVNGWIDQRIKDIKLGGGHKDQDTSDDDMNINGEENDDLPF